MKAKYFWGLLAVVAVISSFFLFKKKAQKDIFEDEEPLGI